GLSRSAFFLFTVPSTTVLYTLSLHDALPISCSGGPRSGAVRGGGGPHRLRCPDGLRAQLRRRGRAAALESRSQDRGRSPAHCGRSEEHTSELQSRGHLVCRLLLEKKKKPTWQ